MCGVERPFLDEQKFLKHDHNPLFSLIDDRTDRTEPNRSILLHTRGESLPLPLLCYLDQKSAASQRYKSLIEVPIRWPTSEETFYYNLTIPMSYNGYNVCYK